MGGEATISAIQSPMQPPLERLPRAPQNETAAA